MQGMVSNENLGADLIASVASRQHLRSDTRHLLVVPRHRLSFYGRRAFCVAGPSVWTAEESTYWREQFQTISEDVSVRNVLMHSAH